MPTMNQKIYYMNLKLNTMQIEITITQIGAYIKYIYFSVSLQ